MQVTFRKIYIKKKYDKYVSGIVDSKPLCQQSNSVWIVDLLNVL
jgi:hypothetical protein